jgi:hypothetical protein
MVDLICWSAALAKADRLAWVVLRPSTIKPRAFGLDRRCPATTGHSDAPSKSCAQA